jgi:ferredoxin-NADP reductase
MLDKIKEGDTVKVQYPFGKFTLQGNPAKKIAFLSGGIGITPIRSITKYVVDKDLNIDMVLIYANRSVRDILFKEDFDAMQEKDPKLKVAHVLCEPTPDFKCRSGFINAQVVRNEVTDYFERKFFLCGPPPMVESMKEILLKELSCAQANIALENFMGY